MAVERVIKVKVETKQAEKAFDDLGGVIQEQKDITIEFEKELRSLETQLTNSSKANLSQQKNLKDRIGGLKEAIKDQKLAVKDLTNQKRKQTLVDKTQIDTAKLTLESITKNEGAITLLDTVTGGLASRVRDTVKATKLFNLSLKGTKTALIATGIGAFIVALGLVVAYWDDIIELIGGANAALERQQVQLEQNASILDGEISLNKARLELAKKQGKSTEDLLLLEKELLKQKKDNLKAQLLILESQLATEESKIAEVTLSEKILIAAYNAAGLYSKAAQAAAEAVAGDEEERLALIEKRNEILRLKTEITKLDTDIQFGGLNTPDGEKGRKKETLVGVLTSEQQQAVLDKKSEQFEEIFDLEKMQQEMLDGLGVTALENFQNSEELKTAIVSEEQRKRNLEAEDARKKQEKQEDALADYKIQTAGNILNALGGIAKEGSAGAKGIAIAQAVLATYQGINKAFAETTDFTPTQTLRFANAAAVGIAGFANVAKILSTDSSGKSKPSFAGGGRSGGGGGGAAAPSFNVVGTSGVNQLAESLQQDQQPVQAYVVGSNVTSQQELDRNIVDQVSLG